MNAIAAYGLDPVVTIGAAAAIIVLLAAWVVIRVRRARSYRPIEIGRASCRERV